MIEIQREHDHKHHKNEYHHQLRRGSPLDRLSGPETANLTRAVLNLLLKEQWVELTTQTDAKGGLEKEKDQTGQTDETRDRAIGIDHHEEDEHDQREDQADEPGELLLPGADIFRCLAAD